MLRLSIITTLYNSAGYMDKCLETLLDQDLSQNEYEIILVNDGSPDNSLDVARSYEARCSNVRVVTYEINRGLAGARQAGTDEAKGQFLCYVDPDDYIRKRSFRTLLDRMDAENLDMIRFDYQMVNEDYKDINKPKDAQIIDYAHKSMHGKDFLNQKLGYACFVWAFIYRTSLIKDSEVKFRQGDYFDDTAWLPQIILNADKIAVSNEVRYYYLQRSDSLVNTISTQAIKRKLDAQIVVIQRLQEQMNKMGDEIPSWYTGMISKTALQILTTAACIQGLGYAEYVRQLKKLNAFPLSGSFFTDKQKAKMYIANISPALFRAMISVLNRQ